MELTGKFVYNCWWLFWTGGLVLFAPLVFIKYKKEEPSKYAWLIWHEEGHVQQYAARATWGIWPIGWVRFWFEYIVESIKHGYKNNKFEIEANQYADKWYNQ